MTPRAPEAVLTHLLAHLPPGWVWPREPDSNVARAFAPLAQGLARLEADAAALQVEAAGPRDADRLLDAYEGVLAVAGIDTAALSAADRRAVAHMLWIARGGQSRAYFIGLAAALGTTITITEMQASQCGLSVCGDVLAEADEAFRWVVSLPADRLIDPECGAAECGDALGDITLNICEVAIRAAAPAHTTVVFSYV